MSDEVALSDREVVLWRLQEERPRSPFLRWSGIALTLLVGYSWLAGDWRLNEFTSAGRLANVERFLRELVPHPLQSRPWDWPTAIAWARALMADAGWQAAATTLELSIVAIVLAGVMGGVLSIPATRSIATSEPYLPGATPPSRAARAAWSVLVWATRGLLVFLRAIPEYIWAFLFVAVVGPNAWAAVLALAVHNAGILGKLNAEVIENLNSDTLVGLRALGAERWQIVLAGIVPAVLPRFLLLFFYRWETCVREATVLGMLGIVSLGFYVQDARARQHYDVMLAFILLGSLIVIVGDLLSAVAREAVRRSS